MAITKIEYEKREKAIELPNGTVLDVPERTKANDDKIQAVLNERTKMKEYDFLVKFHETMFGKAGLKEIAPDLKTANLDYLTAVYLGACEAFYADKIEQEQAEAQKRMEELEPLTDKLNTILPLVNKLK